MYYFKNLLLYSRHRSYIRFIVIITKEGSTKIINFMTPGAGVLVLGHDKINHIVHNCYSAFHDPQGRGSCAMAWPYKFI